jgi:hypothetical protein
VTPLGRICRCGGDSSGIEALVRVNRAGHLQLLPGSLSLL